MSKAHDHLLLVRGAIQNFKVPNLYLFFQPAAEAMLPTQTMCLNPLLHYFLKCTILRLHTWISPCPIPFLFFSFLCLHYKILFLALYNQKISLAYTPFAAVWVLMKTGPYKMINNISSMCRSRLLISVHPSRSISSTSCSHLFSNQLPSVLPTDLLFLQFNNTPPPAMMIISFYGYQRSKIYCIFFL